MARRPMKPDPLHDGSVGSCVARFAVCFVLGVFADLLILAGTMLFDARIAFRLWFVWFLVPVIFGVGGVFAFDMVVELYDRMNDDYTRDRM